MKLSRIHPIGINIIVGTLFARLAGSMSMPFLAIYLTTSKGVSPATAGAIIGISALVGVFASFIGGNLSDQYGRKKIMIYSMFIWAFVFIGYALADSVLQFFLLNAINGVCRSFFEPTSRALLSDLTEAKNKLLIFNLRYAAINVGVAIGPLIGLQLGGSATTIPFLIGGVVYILYALSLVRQFKKYDVERKVVEKRESVTMLQSLRVLWNDKVFLVAITGIILAIIGYSQFSSTVAQYFANASVFHDGVALFSYMLVLNAITVLVVQYPVTRIGKKYSALVSIMIGALVMSLGLFGIGLSSSVLVVAAFVIVFTIGEVLMFCMTDMFIDEIAAPHLKGTYFGAMGFTNIGNTIGPWIGGLLIGYYGYENGFIVLSIIAFISTLSFPVLYLVKILIQQKSKIGDLLHSHQGNG